jgi:hypothetical protein
MIPFLRCEISSLVFAAVMNGMKRWVRAGGLLLQPGLRAFQTYRVLFLGIQGGAAVFLAVYFLSPGVREACGELADWKRAGGWWFASWTAMLSGVVVPELLKWKLRPPGLPNPTVGELVHQMGLFAILGAMVDQFYQWQTVWFGPAEGLGILLLKIFVDQFLYSLFITNPIAVGWFFWREHGYRMGSTLRALRPGLFRERVLPMWATGLVFWSPLLLVIYALPAALQFVAFLFANCAWGILMVFIARRQIEGGLESGQTTGSTMTKA